MKLQDKFTPNEWSMITAISEGKLGTASWLEIALAFGIKPEGTSDQRRKAANDVWRKFKRLRDAQTPEDILEIFNAQPLTLYTSPIVRDVSKIEILNLTKSKPKRLFFDIETSYNIVKAWRAGYNLNILPNDIIHERAIITVAYKWEGDKDVTVLTWDKGNDKELITEFLKVMTEADELVGHNIDKFDIKFIMARALYHGLTGLPKYNTTDTLKVARKHFMLNSNKLDYIAQYLGIGSKLKHRGMSMWDDIILRNDKKALEEMIEYNVQDVFLTEEVYNILKKYTEPKVNHAVLKGAETHTCPDCGSTDAKLSKTYVTKAGTKSYLMSCTCGTNFTLTSKKYTDNYA